MRMQEHLNLSKKHARQIKSDYPSLSFVKRLDIAAKKQGFRHYTSLINLYELLGPDREPSRFEIAVVGGNSNESPYRTLSVSITTG
jgi:hypothetical protein